MTVRSTSFLILSLLVLTISPLRAVAVTGSTYEQPLAGFAWRPSSVSRVLASYGPPQEETFRFVVRVAAIVVGLLVAFAIIWNVLRGKEKQRPSTAQPITPTQTLDARYVEYLAKLDELKNRGEISEKTYLTLKSEFWEKLGQNTT